MSLPPSSPISSDNFKTRRAGNRGKSKTQDYSSFELAPKIDSGIGTLPGHCSRRAETLLAQAQTQAYAEVEQLGPSAIDQTGSVPLKQQTTITELNND